MAVYMNEHGKLVFTGKTTQADVLVLYRLAGIATEVLDRVRRDLTVSVGGTSLVIAHKYRVRLDRLTSRRKSESYSYEWESIGLLTVPEWGGHRAGRRFEILVKVRHGKLDDCLLQELTE